MGKYSPSSRRSNKTRSLERLIAEFLELPIDAALDLPRLTILGNNRLILENHRGISQYRPDLIRLKLTIGELKIIGSNMFLREIKPDIIAMEGNILSLEYC